MKAYKFRSSSQIQFALDIILNRQLFCSDWRKLNDPMEGTFFYIATGQQIALHHIVNRISDAKSGYKICSLSADFKSHLLQSHYAGGFDGVAIELDLPDDDRNIRNVEYKGVSPFLDMPHVMDEDEEARRILFSKYNEWSYEHEIRLLSKTEFYKLERSVGRVIAGHRMHEALFRTMRLVCEREGIDFCKVKIDDEGIDAVPMPHSDFNRPQPRVRRPRR